MTLRQEMLNGFGMAHGGMIFAFGDTAFALACNPVNPLPGEDANITVAAGVDINFLKPAFRGQVLTAVANRRASTGRSGLYDIQIYAADPAAPVPGPAPHTPGAGTATAPAGTLPGQLPADTATGAAAAGELIAEFRGRSRTISKK
jgi:acyl-CoA thioesterase